MNSFVKKIMTLLLLAIIFFNTSMPIVQAVYENATIDKSVNSEQYNEISEDNLDLEEEKFKLTDFNIALAGILRTDENLKLDDITVNEILEKYENTQNGLFISENAKEKFENFVNRYTDKQYKDHRKG